MNTVLTGTRGLVFLAIANNPGITRRGLLKYNFHRTPHHVAGLRNQGLIEITKHARRGSDYEYNLSRTGERIFDELNRNSSAQI